MSDISTCVYIFHLEIPPADAYFYLIEAAHL